jgi:hypothetical protein
LASFPFGQVSRFHVSRFRFADTTLARALDSGFGQAGRTSTTQALEGLQGYSAASRFGMMFAKSRNRSDLENVQGGDGAILAAKEKFSEEPPQEKLAS